MPLILLPLLRFLFAVLSIAGPRIRRTLVVLSLALDGLLLAALVAAWGRGGPVQITAGGVAEGIGISLIGDRIALTFAFLAWSLNVAIGIYAIKDRLQPYFFFLLHLVIGACYALAFTKDLFNAYLLFDLLTLSSFLLVGYQRQPRQIWASLNYLVMSTLGMSIFLLGVGVVYAHCGVLDVSLLQPMILGAEGESWVVLATTLLVSGIAVKAGVFLFALWLPSAHARAMPLVSALLSGLVIKMGVLELFRLADVFPVHLPLIVLGAASGLLGILYAIAATDIKRLLAFSTLAQIGYILMGFGAGTEVGRLGALSYAVAHGLFKALLFLVVGEAAGCAGSAQIGAMIEHKARIPWGTRIALAVGMLGIMGLPPLAGYDAKAILEDGLQSHVLHGIFIVISIGTVAAFSKLIPVLLARSATRTHRAHVASYGWLSLLIIFFWPVSLLVHPLDVSLHVFTGPHIAEALAAFLGGGLLYLLLRKRSIRLPDAIFRLEVAPLLILMGFFLVYSLVAVGR
jgi:multicomponent Na+:H+ antiporter subunit D